MVTENIMVRTFPVLLANVSHVETSLVTLNKRNARKDLPAISYAWGKPETKTENVPYGRTEMGDTLFREMPVTRVLLTITGDIPKINGWRFIAALQHLDGENVTRTLPGEDLPIEYRTRGPICDHCRYNRRRNDTYVLRNDTGETLQVGSTCLADFLGNDTAGKLAAMASAFSEACGYGDNGCEGYGNRVSRDFPLTDYLTWVSCAIREDGWISRTKARETSEATGTIKAHSEYKDQKQTLLTRCKVTEVPDSAEVVAA